MQYGDERMPGRGERRMTPDEAFVAGWQAAMQQRPRHRVQWIALATLLASVAAAVSAFFANSIAERGVDEATRAAQAGLAQGQEQLEIERAAFEAEREAAKQDVLRDFGTTARVGEAARAIFRDPSASEADRDDALRHLASALRGLSPRQGGELIRFTTPLPEGTHDLANVLRELLVIQPTNIDLSRVDLHGQYWHRAVLDRALLRSADLRAADVSRSSLRKTYLEDAALACADLSGSDLRGADVSGADLRWVDLTGADLRETIGLVPEQLVDVTHDATTRWPAGFETGDLPSAGYGDHRSCAKQHLVPPPNSDPSTLPFSDPTEQPVVEPTP